jgi:1-deoxy-D-xylulose-5-phosphate synthase
LGIPDSFIEHGSQDELYTECGYNTDGIVKTAHELMQAKAPAKKKVV